MSSYRLVTPSIYRFLDRSTTARGSFFNLSRLLKQVMKLDSLPPSTTIGSSSFDFLDPLDVINAMIDLRTQMAELERQVKALQPAFYAACALLNQEQIATERAIISRRLTPGQWDYSPEIVEQEDWLKLLKSQFQQAHEPIRGRDVYWIVRLLILSTKA